MSANNPSSSIQIEMDGSNTSNSNPEGSARIRQLGGRLIESFRRVYNVSMQEGTPTQPQLLGVSNGSSSSPSLGNHVTHSTTPTTTTASLLAHHHHVPISTAVRNVNFTHAGGFTASLEQPPHNQNTQPHNQFHTTAAGVPVPPLRSPPSREEMFFYPPIGGALESPSPPPIPPRGATLPQLPPRAPPSPGAEQHAEEVPVDDNQRNVETITDAMAQHPELRRFVVGLLKILPFFCIILLKAAFDNFNSLLNLVFLTGIFLHTNSHLKKEISKKGLKNTKKLYFHLLIIAFGLFIKWSDDPYILDIVGLLSARTVHKFAELVYYLLMADLCIKCITVAAKTVITLLPERVVEFKGRGRIYLLVEAASQFYRCFIPVQPWAAYLLNNYEGYDKIFGTVLVVAYVLWAFRDVLVAGKFLRESYIKFKQNSNFGTTPTREELNAVGEQCPICHESFTCPIALECSHIFCDLCIGVWFDRETTCPLCRKKIADDPKYRDGHTSMFYHFS